MKSPTPHPQAAYHLPVRAFVLLLVLLTLGGCGREAETPALPPLATDAVLLAFGDSLTHGTGATREQAFPAVLEARIGRRVINAGVPGETTAAGLARLPDTLDDTRPDLVILCLGGNDLLRRQDRGAMKANLAAMIRLVHEQGLPLVLLGVPQPRIGRLETDPVYVELAREFGLPLEAGAFSAALSDSHTRSDRVHPNAQGYQDVAHAIQVLLAKAGAL